jgi:hypothetical protein
MHRSDLMPSQSANYSRPKMPTTDAYSTEISILPGIADSSRDFLKRRRKRDLRGAPHH